MAATGGADLPAPTRSGYNRLTEKLFINPESYIGYNRHKTFRKSHEYKSSLPLQMALYFNAFFYPIWFISSFVTYHAKYDILDNLYKIVIFAALLLMSLVEIIRLYLGYSGNLTEKIPELAGFWLLTLLLQCPFSLFLLLNDGLIILPLERAMNILYCSFILGEIVCGYLALREMMNHQVVLFHQQQFIRVDDIEAVNRRKKKR